MRHVIGLDVGGTSMKAAVIDERGIVHARGIRLTGSEAGPQAILARIVELIHDLRAHAAIPIDAVGIGVPGLLDAERGISVHSPNLHWRQVDLRTPLSRSLDLPLFFENDLRVATLGEWTFGAGRGSDHLVFMPIGTGLGVGIITHGRLLTGANGFAGELGHVPVPFGRRFPCNCGQSGCLETIASATGIVRLAREKLLAASPSIPPYQLPNADTGLTAEDVALAARDGDPAAREAWQEACHALGWALAAVVNLLNPQTIILGGGVSRAGDLLLQPVRTAIAKYAMPGTHEQLNICLAHLGAEAGMLGAGVLALRGVVAAK